jgi:Na+/melibiose symporter-like transporter
LTFSPRVLPESRATGEGRQLDILGALAVTLGIVALAYAPIAGQQYGWGSPLAYGALVIAGALLLAFIGIEAHSSSPLVPLRIFRNRNANGANTVSFLVGAAHAPMFFLLSLYLQQVLGYDALTAGLAILPIGMTSLVFSLLVLPRALDHLGSKGVLTVGMLLLAVGLTIFARVPVPSNYLLDILPASLIVAIGLPCAFAGTNIAAVTAVPNEETGLASGLMNTTQRVGSGIGIATLTAVLVARLGPLSGQTSPALLASGFQTGFLGAALFALLGAVLTLLIIRQTKQAHADVTGDVEGDKDLAPAGTRKFHFHH